jgi:hypothetical protein
MATSDPFDLPEFMLSYFNQVDFGGNLFGQWPVGIRFDIGLEHVSRAVKIYEFIFGKAEGLILVSQDWPSDYPLAARYTPLFETPGIFSPSPSHFQIVEVSPFDESPYRLTWARIAPLAIDSAPMFQAIANRERGGVPSIASGVYVVHPQSKIILHMYDDRGLDVIAHDESTVRPLYESFAEWVLEDQQHRVAFRFGDRSKQPSL